MTKRTFVISCRLSEPKRKITKALFIDNSKFWQNKDFTLNVMDTDHKLVLFDFELSSKKYILEGGVNIGEKLVEVEAYNEKLIYHFALWIRDITGTEEVYIDETYTDPIDKVYLILKKYSTIDDLIEVFGITNYV